MLSAYVDYSGNMDHGRISRNRADEFAGFAVMALCLVSGLVTALTSPGFRIPAWLWSTVLAACMATVVLAGVEKFGPRTEVPAYWVAVVTSWILILTVDSQGMMGAVLVVIGAMGVYIIPIRGVIIIGIANIAMISLQLASSPVLEDSRPLVDVFYVAFYLVIQFSAVFTAYALRREVQLRTEIEEKNVQLTASAVLLEDATRSAERLRISRELHDLIGHQLTILNLELEAARHRSPSDSAAVPHITQATTVAKELLSDVRLTVSDLRTPDGTEVRERLQRIADAAPGITVRLDIDHDLTVTDEQETVLIRTTQEVITNALKHSSADTVTLSVDATQNELTITGYDNGAAKPATVTPGHGLLGLQERTELLGGSMTVTPVDGFRIEVRLPTIKEGIHQR